MSTKTPLKAIRSFCISCSGGSIKEVRECFITDCPLYDYRFGTNPNRSGRGQILNVGGRKDEELKPSDTDVAETEMSKKTPTQHGISEEESGPISSPDVFREEMTQ